MRPEVDAGQIHLDVGGLIVKGAKRRVEKLR